MRSDESDAPADVIPFGSRRELLLQVFVLTLFSMWAASTNASEHDFWIEPSEQVCVSTALDSVGRAADDALDLALPLPTNGGLTSDGVDAKDPGFLSVSSSLAPAN